MFQAMAGMGSGSKSIIDFPTIVAWLLVPGAIALLGPNSNEILAHFPVVMHESWDRVQGWQERFIWKNNATGVAFTSVVLCASIALIPRASDFIYYRF